MRKYATTIRRYPNQTCDRIVGPPPADQRVGLFASRLAAVDEDGLPIVGAKVPPNGILVNKQMPANTTEQLMNPDLPEAGYKPTPLSYKSPIPGYVDRVLLSSNANDFMLIKILMRQTRRPELGDKFSSRHGQKGVCGLIVNQEDMPFNDQGICPDMIMNPHGFPSRMTVGKMIELIAGKAGLVDGFRRYVETMSHIS